MTYLYIKNVSFSNIEVKDYFVHSIDSENVEKVIVKNINEEKFNAFQYTQNKNIENTARLYLGTMQSNRKVWEITLTDSDYSVFTGTLSVVLKGGFYTNSSHTSTERADYNGDLSFVNGVGTVDVGLFGMSNYGSFIEEHNVPFNTLFYYVIDSTHTTWTDDLSAWGYSLIPSVILPTVLTLYANSGHTAERISDTGMFGSGAWLYYYDGSTYYGNEILPLGSVWNDASTLWSPDNMSARFRIRLDSNNIMKFDGKGTYTSWWQRIEVCSDSTATVVTVYNSSNVAYNAFKYTANGTDYYYVLDGTQTDWADDLSSIGYSLYLTGWANASHTDVSLVRNGGVCELKDGNGNNIPYNDNVTYTGTRIIDSNGNSTTFNYYGGSVYLMKYSNALSIYNNTSKYLTVQRVEYTVS